MQLPEGITPDLLLQKSRKWARVSGNYVRPYQEKAVRFYKIYRAIKDTPPGQTDEEADEITVSVPYAFGIVEHGMAKAVEPIFSNKPPCVVKPKKAQATKQAEAFTGYARKFYASTEFQLGYTLSNREALICGWAWEKDSYAMQYIEGKRWMLVDKQVPDEMGNLIQAQVYEEVDVMSPEKVGFWSWFPSVFDVYPEPGVRSVKDMHYLIEQERNVALEDLRKQFYSDPKTGQKLPVFDLSELDKEYGPHEDGKITPIRIIDIFGYEFGDEVYNALTKTRLEDATSDGARGDIDRVHLLHVWTPKAYWCIANNKWVISYRENSLHKPRIPFRLKNYMQDNHSPFGIGMIEPVENLLYILDDTESMTLQQWYRLVNKMVAVKEDAIVSYDDFEPKAKGILRIRNTNDVRSAVMPYDHDDGTRTMLDHQSNLRGFTEWIVAASDLSPGTEGTKQTHKTLGGLLEIEQNLGERMGIVRRQFLANEQDRMTSMYDFLEQFQFDPVSVEIIDENGAITSQETDREGFISDDGYEFCIENDPAMGSATQKMDLAKANFDIGLQYEGWRLGPLGDPMAPKANIPELARQMYRLTGYEDTSNVLVPADGSIDPNRKFDMIATTGQPMEPSINEDLGKTLMVFTERMASPEFSQMVQTGKITPQAVMALRAHMQAVQMAMQQIAANPMAAVQMKQQMAMQGGQNVGA